MSTVAALSKFSGHIFLIKIGGSILDDENSIELLCSEIKLLLNAGIKIIIVHGGSKAINKYLVVNNIQSEFIDGLRVTSTEAMKIIEMVLCGHINTMLVRKLNVTGAAAIGLSGADNNMLQCDYYSDQHGCVGNIKTVNIDFLSQFIQPTTLNLVLVIAPVGIDNAGNPMNINADYAASYLAAALHVSKLIFLTDQDGIYAKNGDLYTKLNNKALLKLIADKTVTGGMLAKVNAILFALENQLDNVHIVNGRKPQRLQQAIFDNKSVGTICNNFFNQSEIVV